MAQSVPDLQKIIAMSELFSVSTDYLLKDDAEPEDRIAVLADSDMMLRRVSMEEANDFLTLKKESAPIVANGVSLCIASPVILVILGGLTDAGLFRITEALTAAVGCTVLFGMIAAAVFMFITCGLWESHSEHLEKEYFETEYGVTGMVKEKSRAYETVFSRGIAVGVVLCILAVVPLIIAGAMEAPDPVCTVFAAVLLLLIAIGVNLIIRVSIIKSSYDTLLQEGDFTKAEKKVKQKMDTMAGAYWCTVTAVYLGWSFWSGKWDFTWIVWPVAGVLFAAVSGVVKAILSKNDQ